MADDNIYREMLVVLVISMISCQVLGQSVVRYAIDFLPSRISGPCIYSVLEIIRFINLTLAVNLNLGIRTRK